MHNRKSIYCGLIPGETQTSVICFGKNIKKDNLVCDKNFLNK